MSQPQQQEAPPLPPRIGVIHNAAIAGAVLSPVVMLLPPRKMDIRFFVLAGAFSLSTNQLAYEYTGTSIYSRFGNRMGSVFDTGLPEEAKRTQQLFKERKEREAAHRRQQGMADDKKTSPVKDIWMGGEGENWREERAEEHQKSFEEGKGMSDIIFEQIADVWSGNWRKSSKGDAPEPTPGEEQQSGKK